MLESSAFGNNRNGVMRHASCLDENSRYREPTHDSSLNELRYLMPDHKPISLYRLTGN